MFQVQGVGCRVAYVGCRVLGVGCRQQGVACSVDGFHLRFAILGDCSAVKLRRDQDRKLHPWDNTV